MLDLKELILRADDPRLLSGRDIDLVDWSGLYYAHDERVGDQAMSILGDMVETDPDLALLAWLKHGWLGPHRMQYELTRSQTIRVLLPLDEAGMQRLLPDYDLGAFYRVAGEFVLVTRTVVTYDAIRARELAFELGVTAEWQAVMHEGRA